MAYRLFLSLIQCPQPDFIFTDGQWSEPTKLTSNCAHNSRIRKYRAVIINTLSDNGSTCNWLIVAKRINRLSHHNESLTLTEFLSSDSNGGMQRLIKLSASLIILLSLGIYVASQFQGAGKTFHDTLHLEPNMAVIIGASVIFIYTVTGGFWAVSVSDVIQGVMMAIASIMIPTVALIQVGGPSELWTKISQEPASYLSLTAGRTGLDGVIFVLGLLAIGLGATGQPHVVNRFMALRSSKEIRLGAWISISWSIIVFIGMFIAGLCGRVLLDKLADGEVVLLRLTTELFSPVMAGIFVAAILSAIMSTADSQLLVCGSTVAYDLPSSRQTRIWIDRLAIFVVCLFAVVAALTVSRSVFDSALFAWSSLGAAFGPVLMVRLLAGKIDQRYTFIAIWTGFLITLMWFFTPALKSITGEILPGYLVSLVIAWLGYRQTLNSKFQS